MSFIPSCKKLTESEFDERIKITDKILQSCTSCPRYCLVDRTKGELGNC